MAHPWGCGVGMCWRRVGGLTAKIVALADALGNLVRFVLLPGHRHDSLEHFPTKWIPVRRRKCGKIKEREKLRDCNAIVKRSKPKA